MEKRSLILLTSSIAFFITIIILYLVKPSFIMKVDKDLKHTIDWPKILFIAIIVCILVSVSTFLYIPENKVENDIIEFADFSFSY